MSSKALQNLKIRLSDIDQLMDAHSAITRFKKAEHLTSKAGGEIQKLTGIISALVSTPGRGKPSEVSAINRAAFVLLTSHLQGFVDELHEETAGIVLKDKAKDIDAVIKLIKPRNSNPHSNIIDQMFSGLGIYELMGAIKWQKCKNETVRQRLKEYIQTRNKIAHGTQVSMTKPKVEHYRKYVETLATKLDAQVKIKVKGLIGKNPW